MHRSLLPLLVLATGLSAQGFVPPAILRPLQRQPGLSTPSVPAGSVEQIHVVQLPGDAPGVYTTAMSCQALPAANGGAGSWDILTGKYDVFTDTFTPDLLAAGVNGAGTDFGFMLHSSGLIAVWDRLSTVEVATRPNVLAAWTRKGSVIGLPTGPGYFDPSVATLNGQLIVLYATGTAGNSSIAYSQLDINTLAAGPATIVVRPNGSGEANSPTPIVTSTGELVALSHKQVVVAGVDNDHYVSFDLDPNTPSVLFIDTPDWINNGGFAAGIFYNARNTVAPYHVESAEAAWWTGGRAAIGTGMEITANLPPKNAGIPGVSFAMLARKFLPSPLPIPGVTGPLGIDPSFLLIVGMGAHTITTGKATISIPVPNDPSLKGLVIPAQSLSIDFTPPTTVMLGNTAALTILP